MARKLATLQRISEINPIPGADSIEVASILGWKVVIKKGDYKVGDLVVYCEIDSVLPDKEWSSFLKDKKFRIRTVRLRGQISQGICFPLSILNGEIIYDTHIDHLNEEGYDVTEILGITQYIPQIPACIAGLVKGSFPTNLAPKTDETRVQVLQPILDKYRETDCYITEKVDGASCTYYYKEGNFGVCSRNLDLKETPDNAFWIYAREKKIEEKMKALGKNMALQGELIGAGIQKNNLRIPDRKVLFFNVFLSDEYKYAEFESFKQIISALGLETVPIIEENYLLENDIDKLTEKSRGFSKLNPKVYREGIVIRPRVEIVDLQMSTEWGNGRISFKVINPDYLLKYEE